MNARTHFAATVALLLVALPACERSASGDSVAAGSASSGITAPPERFLTRQQAITIVQALPEVLALAQTRVEDDGGTRQVEPMAAVVRDAAPCVSRPCASYWEVAVGDRSLFTSSGTLPRENEGLVDFAVRVDATDGAIAFRDDSLDRFVSRQSFARRKQERMRGHLLVLSTPEFRAMSDVSRRGGAPLALLDDGSPDDGCKPGERSCRWVFMATSIGAGRAGHWERFEFDPVSQGVYVQQEGGLTSVPYGVWRNAFRREARKDSEPELRALGDLKDAFPDFKVAEGPPGYGPPERVEQGPATGALAAALASEGVRLVRMEHYGSRWRVMHLASDTPFSLPSRHDAFRAWVSSIVRANGGYACEIRIGTDRYQLDRHSADPMHGGVYVLRDGSFHPWEGP
jgi:hypothetical protein